MLYPTATTKLSGVAATSIPKPPMHNKLEKAQGLAGVAAQCQSVLHTQPEHALLTVAHSDSRVTSRGSVGIGNCACDCLLSGNKGMQQNGAVRQNRV